MSLLKSYMKKSRLNQQTLSEKLGISQSFLSDVIRFRRSPSIKLAYKIELATNGKVPMKYWAVPEEFDTLEDDLSHNAVNNSTTLSTGGSNA